MTKIRIELLTYNELAALLDGRYDAVTKTAYKPKGQVSKNLSYWWGMPRISYRSDKSTEVAAEDYTFIVAIKDSPTGKQNIIGMVQLQLAPTDRSTVWLTGISVATKYQQRGISKKLVVAMCEYLADKPWSLLRSRPSDDGALYIRDFVTNMLMKHEVRISKHQDLSHFPGYGEAAVLEMAT